MENIITSVNITDIWSISWPHWTSLICGAYRYGSSHNAEKWNKSNIDICQCRRVIVLFCQRLIQFLYSKHPTCNVFIPHSQGYSLQFSIQLKGYFIQFCNFLMIHFFHQRNTIYFCQNLCCTLTEEIVHRFYRHLSIWQSPWI